MQAGDVDYERHGVGYATHRRADPRIAALVRDALGDAGSVVNVGAGAGSYEPTDRFVLAVEPAERMRAQRPPGAAPVVAGVAEALPLRDGAVGAAMAMATVHQWPDLAGGLAELRRVARGAVVVLTFDPEGVAGFWLTEYLPELAEVDRTRMPSMHTLVSGLGGTAEVRVVPVPFDCTDGFVEAYYGRPEAFLDPAVRAAQSAWPMVGPAAEERAVAALAADLASGGWDARHGALRSQPAWTGSVRLVVGTP